MIALPVVLVAVYMTTLDFFIANLAVPSIRTGLGAGDTAVQFVIAGYGLAYAAGLIVSGRLGDLYGRRRVFAAGLALFTVASAACGLSPDAGSLVLARVAQGVAAALLAPQALTLLGVLFEGAARARAFGWYGTTVGVAGVSGQAIGGLLVAADPLGLGWRACFLVNVPIGVAALALTTRVLPAPRAPAIGAISTWPGRRWSRRGSWPWCCRWSRGGSRGGRGGASWPQCRFWPASYDGNGGWRPPDGRRCSTWRCSRRRGSRAGWWRWRCCSARRRGCRSCSPCTCRKVSG